MRLGILDYFSHIVICSTHICCQFLNTVFWFPSDVTNYYSLDMSQIELKRGGAMILSHQFQAVSLGQKKPRQTQKI